MPWRVLLVSLCATSMFSLQACGHAELRERVSRIEAEKVALEAEVADLRASLERLNTTLHSTVSVPVREPPSRPEATVVSIELNETQVVLEGQSFELEEVGARLQELGAEVHVVIAAGAGTSHDRVRELIDQLRAHGIQRFAIRMAEPPE